LLNEEIQEYILNRHFGNSDIEINKKEKENIKKKIKLILKKSKLNSIDELVSLNEDFFTKHKVSKFVVNAVRMYDFFGYEWRLPLWDNELIEYWYRVPNNLRVDSYLFDKYLLNDLFQETHVSFKKSSSLSKNKNLLLIRKLLPIVIVRGIKKLLTKVSAKEDVNNFGILETYLLKDLDIMVKPKNFNSVWSVWIIQKFTRKIYDKKTTKLHKNKIIYKRNNSSV
jgi:asparagine synthase (glutamine-hydrolysing)